MAAGMLDKGDGTAGASRRRDDLVWSAQRLPHVDELGYDPVGE